MVSGYHYNGHCTLSDTRADSLDDQTINSEQVSLIFTNHRSFKKEAVVSG